MGNQVSVDFDIKNFPVPDAIWQELKTRVKVVHFKPQLWIMRCPKCNNNAILFLVPHLNVYQGHICGHYGRISELVEFLLGPRCPKRLKTLHAGWLGLDIDAKIRQQDSTHSSEMGILSSQEVNKMCAQVQIEIDTPENGYEEEYRKTHFNQYDPARPPVDEAIFQAVRNDMWAMHTQKDLWMVCCPFCRQRMLPVFLIPEKNYYTGYFCTCQGSIDDLYAFLHGPSRPKTIRKFRGAWLDLDIDRKTHPSEDDRAEKNQ